MSGQRTKQTALLAGMAVSSWLGMMLVHEFGHVLAAMATGGVVQRVVWHPLAFSRTDVEPNPAPLAVVWGGPAVGVLLPLAAAWAARVLHWPAGHLVTFFAGFCLITNGAYIGMGMFDAAGDAGDLLRLGMPGWVLAAAGLVSAAGGLWQWHAVSGRFGFGETGRAQSIPVQDVWVVVTVAAVLVAVGFAVGNRGF